MCGDQPGTRLRGLGSGAVPAVAKGGGVRSGYGGLRGATALVTRCEGAGAGGGRRASGGGWPGAWARAPSRDGGAGRGGDRAAGGAGRGPSRAGRTSLTLPGAPPLRPRNKGRGPGGARRRARRRRQPARLEPRQAARGPRRRGSGRGYGAVAVADRGAAAAAAAGAAEPLGPLLRQDRPVLRLLLHGLGDGRGRLPAAPRGPDGGEHEARGAGRARGGRFRFPNFPVSFPSFLPRPPLQGSGSGGRGLGRGWGGCGAPYARGKSGSGSAPRGGGGWAAASGARVAVSPHPCPGTPARGRHGGLYRDLSLGAAQGAGPAPRGMRPGRVGRGSVPLPVAGGGG